MQSTIRLSNPTNFFIPTVSKETITLSNPSLFQSEQQKREGYETRLHYEYKATIEAGGFAQFVTLTFNDRSLPTFEGVPCIDNKLIRSLFNNTRFFKNLKTTNGYSFKYFCSSEFGEGGEDHGYVGKRGKGNNPHYHVIIFFTPYVDPHTGECAPNPHLTPKETAQKISHYWQGDSRLYTESKIGIVNFGTIDPYGEVKHFDACSYVSKYVVKGSYFYDSEKRIIANSYSRLYEESFQVFPDDESEYTRQLYIEDKQKELIKKFRSEHSPRVLASPFVGISALDHIEDKLDPSVIIETTKGVKKRTLPLYLYRKLYYDIVKDCTGKYYYKLNELGKEYKLSQLSTQLEDISKSTYQNIYTLAHNVQHLINYCNSHDRHYSVPHIVHDNLNVQVTPATVDYFLSLLSNNPFNSSDNIYYDYALFSKIYKDRHYENDYYGNAPYLDPMDDYYCSLDNSHYDDYYSAAPLQGLEVFRHIPFEMHPYFSKNIKFFRLFDDVNSFFHICSDKQKRKESEDHARLVKLSKRLKFNSII